MLKIIACDDDVAFLDRLHRMIDRWSTETGTAADVALVTRCDDPRSLYPIPMIPPLQISNPRSCNI